MDHVRRAESELVLLPEMPFCSWFADSQRVDAHVWEAAVRSHDQWEHRLAEAAPATIAATRPIDFGNERYNEAFLWDVERGMRGAHAQSDLRDEDGVREAAWYNAATPEFTPIEVGAATVGFLVCTELWRMDQARTYGIEGVQLLLTPRSTGIDELESWLAAARVAAILAGAYHLSSNRVSSSGTFGGHGWIMDPEGNVVCSTDPQSPYISADVDLAAAHVDPAAAEHVGPAPLPRYTKSHRHGIAADEHPVGTTSSRLVPATWR